MTICRVTCNCYPPDETIFDPQAKILCSRQWPPQRVQPCLYFLQQHSKVCEENDQDVTPQLGDASEHKDKLKKSHRSLGGWASGEDRCEAFQRLQYCYGPDNAKYVASASCLLSFLRSGPNLHKTNPSTSQLETRSPFKHYYCAAGAITK